MSEHEIDRSANPGHALGQLARALRDIVTLRLVPAAHGE